MSRIIDCLDELFDNIYGDFDRILILDRTFHDLIRSDEIEG